MIRVGKYVLVLLMLALFVGCTSTQIVGPTKPTIDESPVSDTKIDTKVEPLRLDAELLRLCPDLSVPDFAAGRVIDMLDVKRREVGAYYSCADRHNVLVRILIEYLAVQEAATKPAKK